MPIWGETKKVGPQELQRPGSLIEGGEMAYKLQAVLNMEESLLRLYFDDIADSTPLSREREVGLSAKIHAGDMAARDELVQANLRFVIDVAKNYQGRGLSLIDLISAGNVGLMTAAERFDGTRGFKFISYAVWWIKQSILQTIANHARTVRLPMNRLSQLKDISKVSRKLGQGRETEPEIEEIAAEPRGVAPGGAGHDPERTPRPLPRRELRGRRRALQPQQHPRHDAEGARLRPAGRFGPLPARGGSGQPRRSRTEDHASLLRSGWRGGLDDGADRRPDEPDPRAHPPAQGAGPAQAAPCPRYEALHALED